METFVVRLWTAAEDAGDGGVLRGVVERVATGARSVFADEQELLAVLRAGAARERGAGAEHSPSPSGP